MCSNQQLTADGDRKITKRSNTMRYPSESDMTQMMGIGYLGEVRQGLDGNLYQWVEGVDGLGNPVGFWKKLKKFARKALPYVVPGGIAVKALRAAAPALRKVMPIAQQAASLIPGGQVALTAAAPVLRQAGVAGYNGLGALYQAPDGTLYQMQGFAEDEELRGMGEDELTQMMGIGYLGEVRQAPDGNIYQWIEGIDGLGNPIGFWKKLVRGVRRLAKRALPIVQQLAPFVPGVGPAVAAGLKVATPLLQQAGVAGQNGLGTLYQAPDGTLYQMQGFAEDEELRGFAEDEELRGFAEEEELRGFADDEELRGFDEDEELQGFAEDEELRGLDQGYVRQDNMSGLEAYVPQQPPSTRWFTPPAQAPKIWESPW
jgi:negative regulator of sigma E activity